MTDFSLNKISMDNEEYMLLDPDKVEVWDLCLLLLHGHIGARNFIDSNDDERLHGSLFRRFIIFIFIVTIKVLQSISKLMDLLGRFIESSLNLWSQYDSFYVLIVNTLRGKNELCRESANYSSAAGLTDTRMELDNEIHRQDPRYNSALAIMAAKTAYENKARIQKIVQEHWKMEYIGFFNCSNAFETKQLTEQKRPTQAFMFCDKTGDYDFIWVSFRGTSPFSVDDWCTDLDLSWYHLQGIGKAHVGFLKALGLQKNDKGYPSWPKELDEQNHGKEIYAYYTIRSVLRRKLKENINARFIVTGHSLGGALAVLFPAILAFHNELELLDRLEGVYTFGQPRVGDLDFGTFMEELLGVRRYFRVVYANDIVPRIPFDDSDLLFKHFGYCYYFNSFYRGQVLKEAPNKNYFSIRSIFPMYMNAIFEMLRSVILPYAFGSKYKEGILLFVVRSFGLLVPGVSAHCPQDYVNLTRLASPETFCALQEHYSDD